MRRVDRYVTQDGKEHESESRAMDHADDVFGLALSNMAHELVKIEKYIKMAEWLDNPENLQRIANLIRLRADRELVNPPESED